MARKRTRKRKKNPGFNFQDNHSGLGAFVGSLVGGVPGHVIGAFGQPGSAMKTIGWVLTPIGWIIGGGLGGYYGAKADRREKAAAGGAIGGAFTPLGAALGGYLAGLSPGKKKNPAGSTIALALGTAVVAAAAGYGTYRIVQRRKATALPGEPGAGVASILDASSTLSDSAFVVGDVQQPIQLQARGSLQEGSDMVPQLRVLLGDNVVEPATAIFGAVAGQTRDDSYIATIDPDHGGPTTGKAIGALLTGLRPEHARAVYELALVQIGNGVNWANAQERDAAIARILTQLVPSTDWSQGLSPYTFGSPEWSAWAAVQTLGTVAAQSYFNKRALAGGA